MSEFKFACPVCGQHITAAVTASGKEIECPTCFRKIVVPQAPTSDSKLILSAAQADKPKPTYRQTTPDPLQVGQRRSIPFVAFLLVLLGAAGAALFVFRDSVFPGETASQPLPTPRDALTPPPSPYPVPTNAAWEMNLRKVTIPETPVAGRLRGAGFLAERATLQGGNLNLRQGKTWPPDLGVTIFLHAKLGEDLAGRTVVVGTNRPPPVPRITLRWKENGDGKSRTFSSGYAMRIVFGQPEKGRMPAEIYLALPDEEKSFLAGTFKAEIRKPNPPKQKGSKPSQKAF